MNIRMEAGAWSALCDAMLARKDVESAAILLAESLATDRGTVLAVRKWSAVPEDGYQVRRSDQLRIAPVTLNRLTRPARERGLSILTLHTHPGAHAAGFSLADDVGDSRLMPSFAVQVPDIPHGSLVLAGSGEVAARLFPGQGPPLPARLTRVGRTLDVSTLELGVTHEAWFSRQALALGGPGQARLRALRVGVVGLGGTGSHVAVQLAHLGVGCLVLLDADVLEDTNVSRVLGASVEDVGRSLKVDVAARYVRALGLPVQVEPHAAALSREAELRLLRGCDVVFSCVDRHTPRALLNRLSYTALQPLIDMGSGFRVDARGVVTGAGGRVVVVGPGQPCLACWGHIDSAALRNEALSHEERAVLAVQGYVEGADIPQPSVVAFNGMVASAAVVELLRRVTAFAGAEDPPGRLHFDFTEGTVRRNRISGNPRCAICAGA